MDVRDPGVSSTPSLIYADSANMVRGHDARRTHRAFDTTARAEGSFGRFDSGTSAR